MEETTEDVLTVTLKGKEYPLNFPIAELQLAKKKYGSLKKLLDAVAENSDEVLPVFVAAGIGDPEITTAWIANNINYPTLHRQNRKIMAAFTGKTKTEYEKEIAEEEAEAVAKKARTQLAS